MAENKQSNQSAQEAATKKQSQSKITAASPKPPAPQKSSPSPTLLISIIAMVLAIIAVIEGAYLVHKTGALTLTDKTFLKQTKNTLSEQEQQLKDNTAQLKTLSTAITTNTAQLTKNQASLQNLNLAKDLNRNSWVLREVRYLLTMANYHLQLVPSPQTALAILQKAQSLLITLSDPKSLPLRQAITNAITQLQALPTIDYAGILIKLNAISHELPSLPLVTNKVEGNIQTMSASDADTETGWKKYWHKSLKALESLVVIRHHTQPMEPLVTPKQQHFLVENIQLKLAAASWALLHHNEKVYQTSLQEAINWIEKYYATDADATSSVLTSLKALEKINLQPTLPNLSKPIYLSNALIHSASSNAQHPVSKGDKK